MKEFNGLDEEVIKNNDYNSMRLLFIKTRDEKYYQLCSHELKTNIDFVLFLTNIFDDDLNFTFSVINYYLYAVGENDPKFPRLLSKIDNYIKTRENEFDITYYMQYRCKIINFFDKYQCEVESILSTRDEEIGDKNSIGFEIIKEYFPDDIITQEFFANHYLDRIFDDSFERKIHIVYKNLDYLNKFNETKVLLDYINSYDIDLGDFVINNKHLLEKRHIELKRIKDNFDQYKSNNKLLVRNYINKDEKH